MLVHSFYRSSRQWHRWWSRTSPENFWHPTIATSQTQQLIYYKSAVALPTITSWWDKHPQVKTSETQQCTTSRQHNKLTAC